MLPDTPRGRPGSRRRTPPTARPGRPPARAARPAGRAALAAIDRVDETAARRRAASGADIGAARRRELPRSIARAPTGAVTVNPQLSATLRRLCAGIVKGASTRSEQACSLDTCEHGDVAIGHLAVESGETPIIRAVEPEWIPDTVLHTEAGEQRAESINGSDRVEDEGGDRSAALVADSSLAVDDIDGDPSGVRRRVRGNAVDVPSRPSWQPPEARRRSTPRDRAAAVRRRTPPRRPMVPPTPRNEERASSSDPPASISSTPAPGTHSGSRMTSRGAYGRLAGARS